MLKHKPKLLVFIVAYNAEKTIESVLNRIPHELEQYNTEVLIIDDASSDRTWETAQSIKKSGRFKFPLTVLVNAHNQGYGGNQKLGFLYAIKNSFDIVALVHGDGQYAPEMLPTLVKPIEEGAAEVVFGSRMMTMLGALKGGMPFYKYVGNRILTGFQNAVLQSRLSEFHTGYRIYSIESLKKIPFNYNTNDFHFDTEIIIQLLLAKQRIAEISIPTFYGDEVCHVNGLKYAGDVFVATALARLQSFGLLYRRNFDVGVDSEQVRELPQQRMQHASRKVLQFVRPGSNIVDIGCRLTHLLPDLHAIGCTVTGIGSAPQLHQYDSLITCNDLTEEMELDLRPFDFAVLFDVVEHERFPEKLLNRIAAFGSAAPNCTFIFTAANVGFAVTRLMLLIGQFNYGKRGILDLSHNRLFTFGTLRTLLETSGLYVTTAEGVTAPFQKVFKSKSISKTLIAMNEFLIKLNPKLFGFEIFVAAKAYPSIDRILYETTNHSEARRLVLNSSLAEK